MKQLVYLGILGILLSSCLGDRTVDNIQPTSTFEERLVRDQEIIDAYLAENDITAEIEEPNGLRYVLHEQGTGESPDENSNVAVRYEGTLLDSTVFDASDSIAFSLENVIIGWRIGVPLLQEGGSITLYIPSVFAYDLASPGAPVPPSANLIFDIELLKVLE